MNLSLRSHNPQDSLVLLIPSPRSCSRGYTCSHHYQASVAGVSVSHGSETKTGNGFGRDSANSTKMPARFFHCTATKILVRKPVSNRTFWEPYSLEEACLDSRVSTTVDAHASSQLLTHISHSFANAPALSRMHPSHPICGRCREDSRTGSECFYTVRLIFFSRWFNCSTCLLTMISDVAPIVTWLNLFHHLFHLFHWILISIPTPWISGQW